MALRNKKPIITQPKVTPLQAITDMNSFFNEFVSVKDNCHIDNNSQVRATTYGQPVNTILHKTGRMVFEYSSAEFNQSTIGLSKGGYPVYNTDGTVHIPNKYWQKYKFENALGSNTGIGSIFYCLRLHQGKEYEGFCGGDRWPELKNFGGGSMQYLPNDYVNGSTMFSYNIPFYKTILFEFKYTATQVIIMVTDSVSNRSQVLATINQNATSFERPSFGNTSHPASCEYFAMGYKSGTITQTERDTIINNMISAYNVGSFPSESYVNATLSYNGSQFMLNYTPYLVGGASSLDVNATLVNYYCLDSTVGQALDNIKFIKQTTLANFSLVRASYPTFFPSGHNNELIVEILPKDNLGKGFKSCGTSPVATW